MTREQLTQLAERVQGLAGPDREVDALVHDAFGLAFVMEYYTEYATEQTRNLSYVPQYSRSLDAAMSLASDPRLGRFGSALGILRWAIEMVLRDKAEPTALPRYVTAAALLALAECVA